MPASLASPARRSYISSDSRKLIEPIGILRHTKRLTESSTGCKTNTAPEQTELPFPFPELSEDLPLLPARMVNELAYCPRLAYLEWVQGEWADSSDTVEGRHVQRRGDKPGRELSELEEAEPEEEIHARATTLSSNRMEALNRAPESLSGALGRIGAL